MPAAAAANSGSNGSPATAAPSSTKRASCDSKPSSSTNAAATLRGTNVPPSETSGPPATKVCGAVGRPGELLEIERIASALLIKGSSFRFVYRLAQELSSLSACERSDLCTDKRSPPIGTLERSRQPVRTSGGGAPPSQEHRCDGRPMEQRTQQLDRCCVRPVDVVEHKDERLDLREPL